VAPGNGTSPYTGQLDQSFKINNPSLSPLTISLFNLVQWQPGGDYFNKSVTASGDINSVSATDGVYQDTHTAIGATAFQAGQGATLANLLTDSSVNDLDNSGLPYSGTQFGDIFEWTFTVPANSSQTIQSELNITHAVPEPNGFFLLGPMAAGFWAVVWRKKRNS
jgi:hypothetical protein